MIGLCQGRPGALELLPALLLAVATLLAACAPPNDMIPARPPPDPALAALEGHPTDASLVDGCLLLARTGAATPLSEAAVLGVDLAIDLASRDLSLRRVLRWHRVDTASTAAGVQAAFLECLGLGARIVVGPFSPGEVAALLPVVSDAEVVVVLPAPGAASSIGWGPGLFAVQPPAVHTAEQVAVEMRVAGLDRAAVLAVDDPFGAHMVEAFVDGSELEVEVATLPVGAPRAWAEAATAAMTRGAQGLFVVGPPDETAAVATAAGASPTTRVWLIDWALGPAVAGAPGVEPTRLRAFAAPPPAPPFARRWAEHHEGEADPLAVAGYDAVRLAGLAVEGSSSLWWEAVAASLASLAVDDLGHGPGRMVRSGGVTWLDSAAARPFALVTGSEGERYFAPDQAGEILQR